MNSKYKMKTKTMIIVAVAGILPLTAFSQPQPAPPAPPNPPTPPLSPRPPRDRDDQMPKVPVTFLGVETSEVPSVLCDQLGLPKGFGLVVDYVVPDGPAAAAGVQQNDVIKMLNDQILTDPGQLSKLIRSYSEGTNVTLTLLRKGQEQKVTVKLAKKEVSRRHASLDQMHHMNHDWNFQFGDMGEFSEQMSNLKEQLGDSEHGMIHDAVMTAQVQAQRARDQAQQARDQAQRVRDQAQRVRDQALRMSERVRDEVRNAAGQIQIRRSDDNGVTTTNIDVNKAQIVFSDDKGELRIENKDGKKMLTAKDPQGKLLFSGPIENKEDLDKVPAAVRQRYEKLQQHDLPAIAPEDLRAESENDGDDDDDADDETETPRATTISYDQISCPQTGHRTWEIHTVLI
jgi:serine protease Do